MSLWRLAELSDRIPWYVWLVSGLIGLLGTFGLAAKGMHNARITVG